MNVCMCEGHVYACVKHVCAYVKDMCACVKYVCVYVCAHARARTWTYEGQKTASAVIPQDLFLLVFKTRSLTSLGATE